MSRSTAPARHVEAVRHTFSCTLRSTFLWAVLTTLLFAPTLLAQQATPTPGTPGPTPRATPISTPGTAATITPGGTPTPSGGFADPAFRRTWERTDLLVADGRVARSWYWGPQANTGGLQEDYAEGPGGKHLVQYFDKSRMEINNPNADPQNPFYVTNGLLALELITGRVQVGNTQFQERTPAQIPLASDTDDASAPTYASFQGAVAITSTSRVNTPVVARMDRAGTTSNDESFNTFGVKYAFYETSTRHNIPEVFWTFLNESGPVAGASGEVRHSRLSDPYFYVTGYPVSEAFWALVKIEGKTGTAVLVQAYERRVLTYVPSAPEGFKVQMGNIGLHYYDWRYRGAGAGGEVPLACGASLGRNAGIGKLWHDNVTARRQLGCPSGGVGRVINVAQQQFERGQMLNVILPGPGETTQKTIYVLYNDGTAQRFPDTYVESSPEPTPFATPPVGFLAPQRGFGKVWRDNPDVRQRLGWAASGEQTYSNSPYQGFERGLAVLPNSARNELFVLYDERGASAINVNRWVIYPALGQ